MLFFTNNSKGFVVLIKIFPLFLLIFFGHMQSWTLICLDRDVIVICSPCSNYKFFSVITLHALIGSMAILDHLIA